MIEKNKINKQQKSIDTKDKEKLKPEGQITNDPVTSILINEFASHDYIKVETLYRMLDFQLFDLERNGRLETIEDLEIYAESTRSLLIYLNLNVLGINDEKSFICASHIGRGIGIVDVLKKFPSLLKLNINMIPRVLVKKHVGVSDHLFNRDGDPHERVYDIFLEMAAYAKKHLDVAREMRSELPQDKNVHVAFLQAIEAYTWLEELEKYNFNIFEQKLKNVPYLTVSRKIIKAGKNKYF